MQAPHILTNSAVYTARDEAWFPVIPATDFLVSCIKAEVSVQCDIPFSLGLIISGCFYTTSCT